MFKRKIDAAPTAPHSPNDAVQHARTRARQRLVGAAVLLVIGIIGFPLVFESQPRPIPVDIAIDIPKRDGAAPLVVPAERPNVSASPAPGLEVHSTSAARTEAGRPAGGTAAKSPTAAKTGDAIITETKAEAGRDVASARPALAPTSPAAKPAVKPSALPPLVVANDARRKPEPSPLRPATTTTPTTDTPAPSDAARARALLDGKPVAAAEAPRYVVQVGAFAEAEAAREVRVKVEKLGMKTYTQIAQTPSGSRIRVRVGPFTTRDEADRALAKARAAGVAANVLTL